VHATYHATKVEARVHFVATAVSDTARAVTIAGHLACHVYIRTATESDTAASARAVTKAGRFTLRASIGTTKPDTTARAHARTQTCDLSSTLVRIDTHATIAADLARAAVARGAFTAACVGTITYMTALSYESISEVRTKKN
jgi:hypothetical protein